MSLLGQLAEARAELDADQKGSTTESRRALLQAKKPNEPPIRTNLMDTRTPKKLATAYHGSPIQSSIGARSRTVLRSVLTGNVRPVSCLDLAFPVRPATACFWGRADIRCPATTADLVANDPQRTSVGIPWLARPRSDRNDPLPFCLMLLWTI